MKSARFAVVLLCYFLHPDDLIRAIFTALQQPWSVNRRCSSVFRPFDSVCSETTWAVCWWANRPRRPSKHRQDSYFIDNRRPRRQRRCHAALLRMSKKIQPGLTRFCHLAVCPRVAPRPVRLTRLPRLPSVANGLHRLLLLLLLPCRPRGSSVGPTAGEGRRPGKRNYRSTKRIKCRTLRFDRRRASSGHRLTAGRDWRAAGADDTRQGGSPACLVVVSRPLPGSSHWPVYWLAEGVLTVSRSDASGRRCTHAQPTSKLRPFCKPQEDNNFVSASRVLAERCRRRRQERQVNGLKTEINLLLLFFISALNRDAAIHGELFSGCYVTPFWARACVYWFVTTVRCTGVCERAHGSSICDSTSHTVFDFLQKLSMKHPSTTYQNTKDLSRVCSVKNGRKGYSWRQVRFVQIRRW